MYPALRQYFNEISQYPLLTREQEASLGRRNRQGDLEARNILINSNLRFSAFKAKPFAQGGGDERDLDWLTLSLEGNMGLINATKRFDERITGFATYSSHWIKKAIFDYFSQEKRVIAIPRTKLNIAKRVEEAILYMLTLTGRIPTSEEISELLADEISVYQREQAIKAASIEEVSLDAPISEDDKRTLMDKVYLQDGREIWRKLTNESIAIALEHAMRRLKPQERAYLTMRYLQFKQAGEIAEAEGLTPTRVRQVILPARESLKKLLRVDPIFQELDLDYLFES